MDAHRVLGIGPAASLDEAEAAYHRLVRDHHPDRHTVDGPDAMAVAEARTRELNAAIEVIRRSTPRGAGARQDPTGGRGSSGPADRPVWGQADGHDWFGNPIPPEAEAPGPVACPLCDAPLSSLTEFDQHLRDRHRLRSPTPARPRRLPGLLRSIQLVPWWIVGTVNVLVVLVLWALIFADADAAAQAQGRLVCISLMTPTWVVVVLDAGRRGP